MTYWRLPCTIFGHDLEGVRSGLCGKFDLYDVIGFIKSGGGQSELGILAIMRTHAAYLNTVNNYVAENAVLG
jgi:hypothetical protein